MITSVFFQLYLKYAKKRKSLYETFAKVLFMDPHATVKFGRFTIMCAAYAAVSSTSTLCLLHLQCIERRERGIKVFAVGTDRLTINKDEPASSVMQSMNYRVLSVAPFR